MEGDGVALGTGHRLLVVAAGRSCLAALQRLPVDCSLLLTGLMRVGGMRNNFSINMVKIGTCWV